jgi:phospholipid/cholesterol/gamma-HCH transport system ATP-binding protein
MKRYTHPQVEPESPAREAGQTVIDIRALTKSFVDNEVLRGVELKLYRGENLVILGRSGAGKTVLIKCIVGLMKPDGGELIVLGKDILKLDYKEMDKVRAKIGFQFQGGALYDSMTVRQNLEFPLRRLKRKMANEEVNELVHEVLDSVGLSHTIDQMPAELSGGMKKRIAMARTLILKPEIIIYDEPHGGSGPDHGQGDQPPDPGDAGAVPYFCSGHHPRHDLRPDHCQSHGDPARWGQLCRRHFRGVEGFG